MKSKKGKNRRKNHLPDGRHVATVSTDELRHLLHTYGAVEAQMVSTEIVRRPKCGERAVAKGYVPFSGGSSSAHRAVYEDKPCEKHKPDRPNNVKDPRKDVRKDAS